MLMLNLETGDYADVKERNCGCYLGDLGLTTHLSGIGSYEKFTSEGVTFMGHELHRLVEEMLPAQFAGRLGDYQIVESEGPDSLPRVSVLVSPRVGAIDQRALIDYTTEFLRSSHAGGEPMTIQWRQAKTLNIIRREPYASGSKVHPLYVIRERDAESISATS
jgi:hypothetical protein